MPSFSVTSSTNDVGITNSRGLVAWNTVVNGTTGTSIDTVSNAQIRVALFGTSAGGNSVQRIYLYFDTGFYLPAGAEITSAYLYLRRGTTAESGTGLDPIHAVLGTFPIGGLTTANFGDLDKGQEFANFAPFGVSVTAPITNLNLISKTGYTKMVLISHGDYANVQPSSGTNLRQDIYSANDVTPGNRPTLSINYVMSSNSIINFV